MSNDAIRILLVEAGAYDDRLLCRLLSLGEGAARCPVQVERAKGLRPALDRLERGNVELVLLEADLPESPGFEALSRLRERDAGIPVVVLTPTRDEALVLAALRAGAQDCLAKERLPEGAELHGVLRRAIERGRIAQQERRRRERCLEGEPSASLGALCAGVGVGLERLVEGVLGETDAAAEALEKRGSARELRKHLLAARRCALHAASLAEGLRDYAGEPRAPAHALDLSHFVIDASSSLEVVAAGALLHYDVPAGGPVVVAGRLPLYRILVALVRNASEALGATKGRIRVATGVEELDEDALRESVGSADLAPDVHAFLRVSDDGGGMSREASERLFQPFYTTKAPGRGLGLAAAAGLARSLGGRIHVRTQRGEGSAFTLLLPLA